MRIDALRPSDAGQYSCEAENEAGRISAPVSVTVHGELHSPLTGSCSL